MIIKLLYIILIHIGVLNTIKYLYNGYTLQGYYISTYNVWMFYPKIYPNRNIYSFTITIVILAIISKIKQNIYYFHPGIIDGAA